MQPYSPVYKYELNFYAGSEAENRLTTVFIGITSIQRYILTFGFDLEVCDSVLRNFGQRNVDFDTRREVNRRQQRLALERQVAETDVN